MQPYSEGHYDMNKSKNHVAYYRVSTQRQGRSGLGLEAQRKAVAEYLSQVSRGQLVQEFTEVETGKGKAALTKRPVLREALAYAKQHKATLIVAKLDRLARNVAFVSALMESKVPFVCADMPEANELTLHIIAAVAQYEARAISERTKAALAAAKARGVRLGNPNLKLDNSKRKQAAQAFAENMWSTLDAWRNQGLSQRAIVGRLNALGVPAARGGGWSLVQLQRVLARVQ
jgi:DNA invertase Pin-like site-specific DNA recombinase